MENDIKVSVCCLVYNHEKYLRQCLDGFVMQKTSFKFEVLIHDDASTDGSQDIIREYEEKYPDIIKPIYQTENQYSKGVKISQTFLYPKIKSKYVAFCEGDDYWCDDHKLQKQFDIMEMNSDCSICVHRVDVVYENDSYSGNSIPSKSHNFVTGRYTYTELLPLFPYVFCQLSSYFVKKEVLNDISYGKYSYMTRQCPVGDLCILNFSLISGDLYYIDNALSCYRQNSIGSWSSMQKNNTNSRITFYNKMLNFMDVLVDFSTKEENLDFWIERLAFIKNKYPFQIALANNDYNTVFKNSNRIYRKLLLSRKERILYFNRFVKQKVLRKK